MKRLLGILTIGFSVALVIVAAAKESNEQHKQETQEARQLAEKIRQRQWKTQKISSCDQVGQPCYIKIFPTDQGAEPGILIVSRADEKHFQAFAELPDGGTVAFAFREKSYAEDDDRKGTTAASNHLWPIKLADSAP